MTFAPMTQPQVPQDAPAYDRPGWVPPPPYPPYPPYPVGGTYAPQSYAPPAPVHYAPYGFHPPYPYAPPMPRRTSPDAAISLIAGVAAWVFVPLLGAVIAVVFGVRARRQIREARGTLDGAGMATVGLVLGGLQLVGFALLILMGVLALAVGFGMFVGSR